MVEVEQQQEQSTTGAPSLLVESPDGSRAIGQLRAAPGVLIRGTTTHLVEHLHWFGERVGHLREFEHAGTNRTRWVVYGVALGEREGADVVGDEADAVGAMLMCRRFLLAHLPHLDELRGGPQFNQLQPSHRTVGPSSRKPGAGPTEGTTYRARDPLTVEQRTQRGCELAAVLAAVGAERERLATEFSWKHGYKPAAPLGDVT